MNSRRDAKYAKFQLHLGSSHKYAHSLLSMPLNLYYVLTLIAGS